MESLDEVSRLDNRIRELQKENDKLRNDILNLETELYLIVKTQLNKGIDSKDIVKKLGISKEIVDFVEYNIEAFPLSYDMSLYLHLVKNRYLSSDESFLSKYGKDIGCFVCPHIIRCSRFFERMCSDGLEKYLEELEKGMVFPEFITDEVDTDSGKKIEIVFKRFLMGGEGNSFEDAKNDAFENLKARIKFLIEDKNDESKKQNDNM